MERHLGAPLHRQWMCLWMHPYGFRHGYGYIDGHMCVHHNKDDNNQTDDNDNDNTDDIND